MISYPEMNRIVAKLRRQLEKIGLGHAFETVRTKGWRLDTSGADFVFRDMPACPPDSTDPAFLPIDIGARETHHQGRTCRLGPLPFRLLQLLMRYGGVPINTRLINLELGLVREPLRDREYNAFMTPVRRITGKSL